MSYLQSLTGYDVPGDAGFHLSSQAHRPRHIQRLLSHFRQPADQLRVKPRWHCEMTTGHQPPTTPTTHCHQMPPPFNNNNNKKKNDRYKFQNLANGIRNERGYEQNTASAIQNERCFVCPKCCKIHAKWEVFPQSPLKMRKCNEHHWTPVETQGTPCDGKVNEKQEKTMKTAENWMKTMRKSMKQQGKLAENTKNQWKTSNAWGKIMKKRKQAKPWKTRQTSYENEWTHRKTRENI